MDLISLELLSDSNIEDVRAIQRDDISEAFVDTADTIMTKPHSTVLDKDWLVWKKDSERNG